MKKLFNHRKREYEEDLEWDDVEYTDEYTDEEYEADGVYEDEEGNLVYSDDAAYEDDAEYADEAAYEDDAEYADEAAYEEDAEYADEAAYEDDAEYADEAAYGDDAEYADEAAYEDDAVYAEEAAYEDDAVYADEAVYEDDAVYADEAAYEDDIEYADEELYEDEDEDEDEIIPWSARSDKNIFQNMWDKLVHMNTMDKVVTTTGILVLVLALATGAVFAGAGALDRQAVSFDTVGSQLDGITLIGEQGLMAVADAELARISAANAIEDEKKEYDESEYTKEVKVELNMTSIEKDLKVKFVNSKTNKLIANVPFSVAVTTPDGKTETWSDDDMDGIIYKNDITPGNYSVAMNALEGEKYADYIISTSAEKVKVKKEIDYEKVDVSDEVKDESEVNAKVEDTKENETTIESTLTDTVAWVESTKTVMDSVYTAVAKNSIKAPLDLAKGMSFMRTAGGTVSPGEPTPTVAPTTEPTTAPTTAPTTEPTTAPTTSPDVPTASPDVPSPSPTVSPSPSPTVSPSPSPVVPTGITLEKTALSMEKGGTVTLKATVTPENAEDKTVTWSSSDETIAKVDNTGKITALKAGTVTITVTSNADTAVKATCKVTVTEETRTLTLSHTTLAMAIGSPQNITATIGNSVSGGSIAGNITAKSDNEAVATVTVGTTANGKATITINPKAAGTAVITIGVDSVTGLTKTCTVTVGNRTITLNRTTASVLSGSTAEVTAVINSTGGAVSLETSNSGVATANVTTSVADNKMTAKVVVNGVAAGSATITVIHTENGVAVRQAFTVTVVNKDTKLLTADNKQLYVLVSDNNYREATYADYYNPAITTFFIRSEGVVKYTGWQTLNGKLYYYDASGKYVTGEQVIQGAKYTFASDGSLVVGNGAFGIDVSKWNGTIDWNAVKNSGVNYVIIRCGYRGSSSGVLVTDPKFAANIKGATAAGIKVGVYFFSQAVNKNEAVEEASMVLELIKGYTISYPVFLDVEASGGRADKIDTATRTEVIKAFCETIQGAGYTAGVYANKSWLTNKIDTSQLGRYKIWLAQYASAPTYSGRYDMWQYKSTGKVTGISGDVDMNWSYLGY